MINISIDPPDLKHASNNYVSNKEDFSINEIESFFELIVEGISGKQVPEHDEDDIDTSSQSVVLYFFTKAKFSLPAVDLRIQLFPDYTHHFASVYQEPHLQPPKFG
jgi:hypothetical protein